MQDLIDVTGMILKSEPIGEYDRRVVILTKERGKISAFARGARKPGNRFMAATNPFCFGEFKLYPGKNAYTLQDIHIDNFFQELRDDFLGAYMGIYFMEVADYYGRENSDDKELLKLLYQSLRALESPVLHKDLVRAVFELKAITINGEGPNMFFCMHCHTAEELHYFSVTNGGMLCRKCKTISESSRIHESTRYAMQFVISTKIEKLFTFQLSKEVLEEFQKIIKEYLQTYLKHSFKSLEIIEELMLK